VIMKYAVPAAASKPRNDYQWPERRVAVHRWWSEYDRARYDPDLSRRRIDARFEAITNAPTDDESSSRKSTSSTTSGDGKPLRPKLAHRNNLGTFSRFVWLPVIRARSSYFSTSGLPRTHDEPQLQRRCAQIPRSIRSNATRALQRRFYVGIRTRVYSGCRASSCAKLS
jgi:hypothetical protein